MMANPAIGWQSAVGAGPRRWQHRRELRPGIEHDTELMPWLVADSVLYEASQFLGEPLPAGWADWLDHRAERCYAKHAHFRSLVRREGATGRGYLYRFFRHWIASRIRRERHDLFRRLPKEYCMGAPLRRG